MNSHTFLGYKSPCALHGGRRGSTQLRGPFSLLFLDPEHQPGFKPNVFSTNGSSRLQRTNSPHPCPVLLLRPKCLSQGPGTGLDNPSSIPYQPIFDQYLCFHSKYTSWPLICRSHPSLCAFQAGENLTLKAQLLASGAPSASPHPHCHLGEVTPALPWLQRWIYWAHPLQTSCFE